MRNRIQRSVIFLGGVIGLIVVAVGVDVLINYERRAGAKRTDNSLGMPLVWCPPGKFTIGSPEDEAGRDEDEDQVEVELTRGFWLGQLEVTQSEWERVMNTTPWKGQKLVKEGPRYPATYVSWQDAVAFCKKLTELDRAARKLGADEEYRLPTEAEWEYACRAGEPTAYFFGNGAGTLGEYAWFRTNAYDANEEFAHEVGSKQANAWHLHDVHGNVWEWCADAYTENLPGGRDPIGSGSNGSPGAHRVRRGGSWYDGPQNCRAAFRFRFAPSVRFSNLGFRVARVPRSGS